MKKGIICWDWSFVNAAVLALLGKELQEIEALRRNFMTVRSMIASFTVKKNK
jgi:hypothetical protein